MVTRVLIFQYIENWPDVFCRCSLLARFCIIGKKLYLRRSQNNAYNHDGLVQTQTLSLSKLFFSFLSHSLPNCQSLMLFTTYTLDIKFLSFSLSPLFSNYSAFYMKICNVSWGGRRLRFEIDYKFTADHEFMRYIPQYVCISQLILINWW